MQEYPNNPYELAQRFVGELEENQIDPAQFMERMDLFEQHLQNWHTALEQIKTSDDYQEGKDLVEDAKQSLEQVYEGVGLLREYAQSRNEDTLSTALDMIEEASQFMAELIDTTEDNLEELERGGDAGVMG